MTIPKKKVVTGNTCQFAQLQTCTHAAVKGHSSLTQPCEFMIFPLLGVLSYADQSAKPFG